MASLIGDNSALDAHWIHSEREIAGKFGRITGCAPPVMASFSRRTKRQTSTAIQVRIHRGGPLEMLIENFRPSSHMLAALQSARSAVTQPTVA